MNATGKLTLLALLLLITQPAAGQTLRSAAEPDYPPLSVVTPNGSAGGFSVELLKATVETMGGKITFKTAPWNQIKAELAEGRLDVLPLVGRTPEREALYDFTIPYLTLHGALFVRENDARIQSLADLPGKRIAVMKGDNAEEYVRREGLSEHVVTTETFDEAFRMLAADKADAVIAQKLMGVSLLKKTGLSGIKVVGNPNKDFRQDFSFAVTKGNSRLLALLNEGLALAINDGTRHKLMSKWFDMLEENAFRKRVLVYRDDYAYPPYSFLDKSGRPTGFNVELLRAIAREAGLNISFELGPWNEIPKKMQDGDVDISCMFYPNPDRETWLSFSTPHSISYGAVFAARGSPAYQSIEDMKGRRIAVQDEDTLHEYAKRQGFGETLIATRTLEEALALLKNGQVDFTVSHLVPGLYWINRNGWKNLRAVDPGFKKQDYCYVVRKDDTALLDLLNSGLQQLKETGEYRLLYNQWLGVLDPSEERVRIRKYILIWGTIILLAAGLTSVWIFSLQRQVNKKTASLRESEERLKLAASAADIGVWDRDIVNNQLIWNKRMYQIYGISPEESDSTYQAWQKCVHPDDLQAASNDVIEAELGRKEFNTEFRIIRPDGEIRHIKAFGKVIHDDNGDPLRMIGINYDITDHKQAEQRAQSQLNELNRWHQVTLGREMRILELKREINELLKHMGEPPRYTETADSLQKDTPSPPRL
jgi:PAS domain S-box-containing protein